MASTAVQPRSHDRPQHRSCSNAHFLTTQHTSQITNQHRLNNLQTTDPQSHTALPSPHTTTSRLHQQQACPSTPRHKHALSSPAHTPTEHGPQTTPTIQPRTRTQTTSPAASIPRPTILLALTIIAHHPHRHTATCTPYTITFSLHHTPHDPPTIPTHSPPGPVHIPSHAHHVLQRHQRWHVLQSSPDRTTAFSTDAVLRQPASPQHNSHLYQDTLSPPLTQPHLDYTSNGCPSTHRHQHPQSSPAHTPTEHWHVSRTSHAPPRKTSPAYNAQQYRSLALSAPIHTATQPHAQHTHHTANFNLHHTPHGPPPKPPAPPIPPATLQK
jgi:hypothetical protein